jgi:hypothetical protein
MLYKIAEPAMLALHFEESAAAASFEVSEAITRTIKLYHPLPYHNDTKVQKEISELYQEGNNFYHIVEKCFERDTFYITIQENTSARERFFALADAVSDLKVNQIEEKSDTPPVKSFSLDDITKLFSPAATPILQRETWFFKEDSYPQYSNFLLSFSNTYLSLFAPPPEVA